MPHVRILPESLCNKIAAVEVVERPASVVKELLENAIDAGADEILIDIEAGGRNRIQVQDNGCGMGREDAFLALERHATSKIADDIDLFRLTTLGFRGEALPSIAAVSRFTLESRDAASEEGWRIRVAGGAVEKAEGVGVPVGTRIEVRNLFFNTPARRKFLRSEQTELGHIGEVVSRQAMARPDIRFRLTHNSRVLVDAYRVERLEERVGALLGRPTVADLVALNYEAGDLALHGLIGVPTLHRATSGAIYTYINGRYVRDRIVQHAVMDGYRSLLARGRYPVAILFLDLPPELVDVNVHPSKHEVRFREQQAVHGFIVRSLQETLRRLHAEPLPASTLSVGAPEATPPATETPSEETPPVTSTRLTALLPPAVAATHRSLDTQPFAQPHLAESPVDYGRLEAVSKRPAAVSTVTSVVGRFASMTILGQYRHSYLLCQEGDDLVLIDQHAAHERIGYERLKAQFYGNGIVCQGLLFPQVLEFDFRAAAQIAEQLEELARFGFDLEDFGGNAYALKGVPQLLSEAEAATLLRDVSAELASLGASSRIEEHFDQLLMTMACHGAVRANQPLGLSQMRALLVDLDQVDFGGHCPHGRPVVHRFTLAEVERLFKRG